MTDQLYVLRAFIATTQHKSFFINAIEAMSGINAGERALSIRTSGADANELCVTAQIRDRDFARRRVASHRTDGRR
jgi:hypothetical protein